MNININLFYYQTIMPWQKPLIKNDLYEIGVAYNGVKHWGLFTFNIIIILKTKVKS